MKSVLCYGDSNTFGTIPGTHYDRFPRFDRWPGALQQILGGEHYVIEEGLSGRTTVRDDPFEEGRNGKTSLLPCLRTHRPLDLVVLMLGTNDLKARFSFTAYDIARGAALLVTMIQQSYLGPGGDSPRVLLVAPPPLGKLIGLVEEFEGGPEKSRRLAEYYRQRAIELGCGFLDAGQVITSSEIDGLHFDAAGHHRLAQAVADWILG
jgi:lysophospholipase L1-like esterase